MEIVGYSERGAMNALFYGIALNRNEKDANAAMNLFLEMAGETETFHNFKLYSEFSLSGFGAPDFVITAENQSGETIVFFIEAKASAGKCYDLKEEKRRHEEYIKDHTKYADGHSSNLFFQLKEKFLLLKYGPNNDSRIKIIDRRRKLGGNEIVCKFYKDIKSDWQNRDILLSSQSKKITKKTWCLWYSKMEMIAVNLIYILYIGKTLRKKIF